MGVNQRPLKRSITVGSAVFLILLGLILSVVTYLSFRNSMYERFEAQMLDTLHYIDSHIDHDDLAQCVRTGQPSVKYEALHHFIDDVYINHHFHYIYILASTEGEDGPGVMEVVTGLAPEDYDVGEDKIYYLGADLTEQYTPHIRRTFQTISEKGELTYFTESWAGEMDYTGALPLKDSSGKVFALLCVDMSVGFIRSTLVRHTIIHLLLIVLMGFIFVWCFVRWMSQNVVRPIQDLERSVVNFAYISHKQRDPNLLNFHEPNIHTQNEVESLSRAVAQMSLDIKHYAISIAEAENQVESMQGKVERMGQLAYVDTLTKVRNKAAYQKQKNLLNRTILTCTARFCIIMVDLNNLKKMNDTYGHKRGDQYLIRAAELVCSVFEHSPVFRIGGDEFVVVLEGEAYDRRDALINRLREVFRKQATNPDLPPWERCSAAIGVAVFTENDHTVDAVFKRADSRMYANKKAMKAQRD